MHLLDADTRFYKEKRRREALPVQHFRNEALRWVGFALLFVAVIATRVWLVPWRTGDGSRLIGVLFCACALPVAALSGVLAYLRLRDWQWARRRDRVEE